MSRSGYYAWVQRGQSQHKKDDETLLVLIKEVYQKSRQTYGSPRVFEALKRQGVRVGRKRIERLMRVNRIRARAIKHYHRNYGRHSYYTGTKNHRLDIGAPTNVNQQWVADLTYVKVGGKWHFLATVMDLYSRKILSWSLGKRKTFSLTLHVLRKAIKRRQPPKGLVYHTDRGAEYCAYGVKKVLEEHGMIASNNRPYHSIDNAEMESFFKTLKGDVIRGNIYHTPGKLRTDLKSYINHFYNTERLHSSLGYLSPNEYEACVA